MKVIYYPLITAIIWGIAYIIIFNLTVDKAGTSILGGFTFMIGCEETIRMFVKGLFADENKS